MGKGEEIGGHGKEGREEGGWIRGISFVVGAALSALLSLFSRQSRGGRRDRPRGSLIRGPQQEDKSAFNSKGGKIGCLSLTATL